jgi:ABC-2 type transport system permease protein
LGRVLAIAKQDLRVLRGDLLPVAALIAAPALLTPFLLPSYSTALQIGGVDGATGADLAVPGMAVTFGFFLVGHICISFFREHSWNTWQRLRASPAGNGEILLGKTLVPLLEAAAQFVVLFGLGGLLMGLRVEGSWLELAAVGAAFGSYLVATGLAVTALCRTFVQANAVVSISGLALAGLAGAVVPYELLPGWVQEIAPAIPGHWAMEGYQNAILGHGSVLVPVLVLLAFSSALLLLTAVRFRFAEAKIGFV